jgi:6,7-dimethyl-8-ribityllumazine synthase
MSATHFEGKLDASGMRFGVVVSRSNNFITDQLLKGALDCIVRHNGTEQKVSVAHVPGSFEIPLAAARLAKSGNYDAVLCLGAEIRGDAAHSDSIASGAARSLARLSLQTNIPVVSGMIATATLEQAIERAGTKSGNKGWDAAQTAIEMVNLCRVIG